MELKKVLETVVTTEYSAFFYTPSFYGKSSSYLFVDPEESIVLNSRNNIEKKLKEINMLIDEGYSAYAILNYEAGYLFEKKLIPIIKEKSNLIQFYFCNPKDVIRFKSSSLTVKKEYNSFKITNFHLNNSKNELRKNINRIKNYIKLGDTYQVNFTVKGKFIFSGDVTNLFIKLLYNQSAEYSSLINNKNEFILSLSPELLFRIDDRKIITKPMKGTAIRGYDVQSDKKVKYNLLNSQKNRAENVMIVDLLRNDLGKLCKFRSIKVDKLFEVEKYESLYQMVSQISGKLKTDISLSDIVKNIFPCGSITGAPKIRTMEIINELEKENRGIYTGSLGFIHKRKKIFNVAIRTIILDKKSNYGEIGLGSGIVWESDPDSEYQETILKSKFLTNHEKEFEIFETMLMENGNIFLMEDHLHRLQSSASFFLFIYNHKKIIKELNKIISKADNKTKYRIKLLLNKWGEIRIFITPIVTLSEQIKIIISKKRISTLNKYQYFKTTNRDIYKKEHLYYRKRGFFDVIYFNEKNELAEGAITNIFLKIGNTYFTPPVTSGILAGVYRKYLLRNNSDIKERTLYFEDLINANEVVLTNSLRREIKVQRIILNEKEFKGFQ